MRKVVQRLLAGVSGIALMVGSQAAHGPYYCIIHVLQPTGGYELEDKFGRVRWEALGTRFGQVTLKLNGKLQTFPLTRPAIEDVRNDTKFTFHPLPNSTAEFRVRITSFEADHSLTFSYENDPALEVESVRLLDHGLWASEEGHGYVVVPDREGMLIPADSGLNFTQRFETSGYDGAHMEMFGVVENGAAALVTWDDPHVTLEVQSILRSDTPPKKQILTSSLLLQKSAKSFRIHLLGRGDYVTIAKAYREVSQRRGLLVPPGQSSKQNPEGANYFRPRGYKEDLLKPVGGAVVPLFELVYRDWITMYDEDSYDPSQAAEYVLHHIAIGRPLNGHMIRRDLNANTPEPEQNSDPKTGAIDTAMFVRGDQSSASGMDPIDRFVKNTHEILSPLNEITARMPMTEHAFLTPDRKVQHSVFGKGATKVDVTVNASERDFQTKSKLGGDVTLPPGGFLIESPTFTAFCATVWNAHHYTTPALFTLRSADAKPLSTSRKIHIFHGFGDPILPTHKGNQTITTEATLESGL